MNMWSSTSPLMPDCNGFAWGDREIQYAFSRILLPQMGDPQACISAVAFCKNVLVSLCTLLSITSILLKDDSGLPKHVTTSHRNCEWTVFEANTGSGPKDWISAGHSGSLLSQLITPLFYIRPWLHSSVCGAAWENQVHPGTVHLVAVVKFQRLLFIKPRQIKKCGAAEP